VVQHDSIRKQCKAVVDQCPYQFKTLTPQEQGMEVTKVIRNCQAMKQSCKEMEKLHNEFEKQD